MYGKYFNAQTNAQRKLLYIYIYIYNDELPTFFSTNAYISVYTERVLKKKTIQFGQVTNKIH